MSKIEGKLTNKQQRRYVIQYNQDELDNVSPDRIKDFGDYVEIGDEMQRLERRIVIGTNPYIIYGVKGTGKTLMIHKLAKKLGYGLVEVICGDNIKERHLFGSPQIDLNGSYWNAGKIKSSSQLVSKSVSSIGVIWISKPSSAHQILFQLKVGSTSFPNGDTKPEGISPHIKLRYPFIIGLGQPHIP